MFKVFLFSALSLFLGSASANQIELLDPANIEVTLIDESTQLIPEGFDYFDRTQCLTPVPRDRELDINALVALGEKLWQIVKDGAPTLEFSSHSASAIPAGANCPFYMTGWSAPQSLTYRMGYKNGFGMNNIQFTYKLIYSAGGSYNGRGAYLANVSIHPIDIYVGWGLSFDANVAIGNIINLGSSEDPVAGMEVALEWNIKNALNNIKSRRVYFVEGRGSATEL